VHRRPERPLVRLPAPGRTPSVLHPHPALFALGQTEEHHLAARESVPTCARPAAQSQLPRSSCSRCLSASRRGSTAPAVTCTGTRSREAPPVFKPHLHPIPLPGTAWSLERRPLVAPVQGPQGPASFPRRGLSLQTVRLVPTPRPSGFSTVLVLGPCCRGAFGPATGTALGTSPSRPNRGADRCAAPGLLFLLSLPRPWFS